MKEKILQPGTVVQIRSEILSSSYQTKGWDLSQYKRHCGTTQTVEGYDKKTGMYLLKGLSYLWDEGWFDVVSQPGHQESENNDLPWDLGSIVTDGLFTILVTQYCDEHEEDVVGVVLKVTDNDYIHRIGKEIDFDKSIFKKIAVLNEHAVMQF